MENPSTPIEPEQKPQRQTSTPNEGQNAAPSKPEVNPSKPGNETEVDLDKSKVKTDQDKTPERH